jgi:hypothetical protein
MFRTADIPLYVILAAFLGGIVFLIIFAKWKEKQK